jgi:hypothetical protein
MGALKLQLRHLNLGCGACNSIPPGVTACQPNHDSEVTIAPKDRICRAGWLVFRALLHLWYSFLNRFSKCASCPEGCQAQPSNLDLGRVPELPIPELLRCVRQWSGRGKEHPKECGRKGCTHTKICNSAQTGQLKAADHAYNRFMAHIQGFEVCCGSGSSHAKYLLAVAYICQVSRLQIKEPDDFGLNCI